MNRAFARGEQSALSVGPENEHVTNMSQTEYRRARWRGTGLRHPPTPRLPTAPALGEGPAGGPGRSRVSPPGAAGPSWGARPPVQRAFSRANLASGDHHGNQAINPADCGFAGPGPPGAPRTPCTPWHLPAGPGPPGTPQHLPAGPGAPRAPDTAHPTAPASWAWPPGRAPTPHTPSTVSASCADDLMLCPPVVPPV